MVKSRGLVMDVALTPNKETLEEFEELYKTNTVTEIADKYEISTARVLAVHKAWGIKTPINIARTYSGVLIPEVKFDNKEITYLIMENKIDEKDIDN